MSEITRIRDDHVTTLTMTAEPRHNALSRKLIAELIDALAACAADRTRVVVLRAPAGSRVWSAGHDVRELEGPRRDPLGWDAPSSIAVMKEELHLLAGAHAIAPDAFERLQGRRRTVYDSADYVEGLTAFRERRPPRFEGA